MDEQIPSVAPQAPKLAPRKQEKAPAVNPIGKIKFQNLGIRGQIHTPSFGQGQDRQGAGIPDHGCGEGPGIPLDPDPATAQGDGDGPCPGCSQGGMPGNQAAARPEDPDSLVGGLPTGVDRRPLTKGEKVRFASSEGSMDEERSLLRIAMPCNSLNIDINHTYVNSDL